MSIYSLQNKALDSNDFLTCFLIFYINTIIITKEFLLIMVSALWLWTSQPLI